MLDRRIHWFGYIGGLQNTEEDKHNDKTASFYLEFWDSPKWDKKDSQSSFHIVPLFWLGVLQHTEEQEQEEFFISISLATLELEDRAEDRYHLIFYI